MLFTFTFFWNFFLGNPNGMDLIELLLSIILVALIYSLMIRRLHDFNQSGWWVLISLVPLVNILFALFLFFKKGKEESNKYGEPANMKRSILQQLFNLR